MSKDESPALCHPGRDGILFIRCDNWVSLRAHAKMGMHEVAGFAFNGNDYVALSYVATADNPLQPTAPNVSGAAERLR
jgi:hypothetical protein